MNVALVYDRVNKWGGAERVLLELHNIWPDAPLFTAVYDSGKAAWARVYPAVYPSFLQCVPFARQHHEWFAWLTPMAFESFSFDDFDVVISVTSADAKRIITKPGTMHVCYCLTPTRYVWSGYADYQLFPGMGAANGLARVSHALLAPVLRQWDTVSCRRPDYYIAISEHIKQKIQNYYRVAVDSVVYPPVSLVKSFGKSDTTGDYYLAVSRLVGHKRVDILVDTFNKLGWPLVIIGNGIQRRELERKARSNIRFVWKNLTDSELASYYERCRAFVHAGDEDFGIAAAEAQAAGKPVVGYKKSGLSEIVTHGVTGVLFDEQNKHAMINALYALSRMTVDPNKCIQASRKFSAQSFRENIKKRVTVLAKEYRRL